MVLAARGLRNLDGGEEPVEDAALAAALKRRSRGLLAATLAAMGVAAGVLFVPWSRLGSV